MAPMTRLEAPCPDRRTPTIAISAPDPMLRMAMPSSNALMARMIAPSPARGAVVSLAAMANPSITTNRADV